MTKERRTHIQHIFSWLTAVAIIVAGICLMAACIRIYLSGNQPFSRESVSAAFGTIALPVYLCLASAVVGFLLDLCLPIDKKRTAEKQYTLILKRLRAKANMELCNIELQNRILREQKKRCLHKTVCAILLATGSLIFFIYALDGSHFHPSEINQSMFRAMLVLFPCMAVPFAYGIFTAIHARKSMIREIELLKLAPTAQKQESMSPIKSGKPVLILRIALLCVGIVILTYGLFSGGTADVLTKAINICTECVGLG